MIARLAAAQHGLVTVRQLHAAGLSPKAVGLRVRAGRLHRVYRGVYAVGHRGLSREGRWMAGVLAAGRGAALSHLCAAAHWELRVLRTDFVTVVAPGERRPKGPIRVHECRNLDPRDVTTRRGIPVTTVARTQVDLTDVLTAHQLANVIYEGAHRKWFSRPATEQSMARANGRHKLHVLERALELNAAGSAGTKSDLEDRLLALLESANLDEPLVNTHVAGEEADCCWPGRRLIVEVDGPGHLRSRAKRNDARKEAIWRGAGFEVLRFTSVEIERRRDQVTETLRARLRR